MNWGLVLLLSLMALQCYVTMCWVICRLKQHRYVRYNKWYKKMGYRETAEFRTTNAIPLLLIEFERK